MDDVTNTGLLVGQATLRRPLSLQPPTPLRGPPHSNGRRHQLRVRGLKCGRSSGCHGLANSFSTSDVTSSYTCHIIIHTAYSPRRTMGTQAEFDVDEFCRLMHTLPLQRSGVRGVRGVSRLSLLHARIHPRLVEQCPCTRMTKEIK